jgi:hypothetical protein
MMHAFMARQLPRRALLVDTHVVIAIFSFREGRAAKRCVRFIASGRLLRDFNSRIIIYYPC